VLIDPRVSGEPVDRGVVGPIPVGPTPLSGLVSLQYQPAAWRGWSVDGQVTYSSAQVATIDNVLKVPAVTQLNLGARYGFKLHGVPASLRAQVFNVANVFAWGVNPNSSFYTYGPRAFRLTLAADF
jgi:iron complex outermembrane receptor protein